MRKLVLSLTSVLLFTFGAFSQNAAVRPASSSSLPDTARFEIVQASGNSSLTFRLDRYTGRIFQMSSCQQRGLTSNGICWKETLILELPRNTNDGMPRYQLFMSGESSRHVFLMNIITGQTWQYGVEATDRWSPLTESINLQQSFEVIK